MGSISETLQWLGEKIAKKIARQSKGYEPYTPSDFKTLCSILEPGDVLLVEGNQKVSAAIKYLTQSTWSHAAIYVGEAIEVKSLGAERHRLVEVNLGEGCVSAPLSKYERYNTRICRPVGLSSEDRKAVINFMVGKIGLQYDLKNIFDLMRYLLPTPPIPTRWRRRMLALGSSSPTKAICSTLLAKAFQSVQYPILPEVTQVKTGSPDSFTYSRKELLHIRHHSLFVPRDFDLSPYFKIIKPTIEQGFDYKQMHWSQETSTRDVLRYS